MTHNLRMTFLLSHIIQENKNLQETEVKKILCSLVKKNALKFSQKRHKAKIKC